MSENILDKRKCPLCGNIVTSKFKQSYATSYLTTDVTWRCTMCGTEFEAEFFYNHGNNELMYKVLCAEERFTEKNILGYTGRM